MTIAFSCRTTRAVALRVGGDKCAAAAISPGASVWPDLGGRRMHTPAEPEPKLPPGWGEVLTRVGQALAVAEADAARREQALQALAPPPTAAAGVVQGLDRFRQRVHGL